MNSQDFDFELMMLRDELSVSTESGVEELREAPKDTTLELEISDDIERRVRSTQRLYSRKSVTHMPECSLSGPPDVGQEAPFTPNSIWARHLPSTPFLDKTPVSPILPGTPVTPQQHDSSYTRPSTSVQQLPRTPIIKSQGTPFIPDLDIRYTMACAMDISNDRIGNIFYYKRIIKAIFHCHGM